MSRTSKPPDEGRPSRLAYVPVALLVLVAALQIWLAAGKGLLTPAKGGGFGMFASVDRLNNRHFVAEIVGPGFRTPLTIPTTSERQAAMRDMLSLPTRARLARFGALVADAAEVAKQSFDADPDNAGRPGYGVPFQSLRITVYTRAFDMQTATLAAVPLRICEIPSGEYGCR